MTEAAATAGARPADRLVVLHPTEPLVLDAAPDVPDDDPPAKWPDVLAAAGALLPDRAVPLGPDRSTAAGHLRVVVARTARTASGTAWVDEPPAAWPDELRNAVRGVLDEDAGRTPTPRRARWMRRGWWDEATTWVDEALAAAGRPDRTGPLEPVEHWSISSVARVPVVGGLVWLKAVPPVFAREGPVLAALGELLAGLPRTGPDGVRLPRVPDVLGTRDDGPAGALLLLADAGTIPDGVAPGEAARLAAGLARLQVVTAGHVLDLAGAGLDDRTPAVLATGIARLAEDAVELDRLDGDERAALRRAVPRWQDRLLALAGSPLPVVLVHGDLHPWNVARAAGWVDGDEVLIDWTDAAVGVAGVDLVTLARLDPRTGSPAGDGTATAVVDAYSTVWAGALGLGLDAVRAAVRAAVPAGWVVQALAFDGILRAVEPVLRPQNAGALADNLRRLAATDR
ncbi:MAG: aminoglycoside phosphotransferase family protein [Kineosporiaceae bacterium]